MDERDVKIAVLEREVSGIREQHKEHKVEVMASIEKLSDNVFDAVEGLRGDVKEIFEFINKSKGSVIILVILCSVLGGTVSAILPEIIHHLWK